MIAFPAAMAQLDTPDPSNYYQLIGETGRPENAGFPCIVMLDLSKHSNVKR